MFDVAAIPSTFYGTGRARHIRKLVHLILASHADPDGTSIFPSLDRLAEECGGLSVYHLQIHLRWLEEAGLIAKLTDKHPVFGTNQYELRMPSPDAIETGKQLHEARVSAKRLGTRERTARWRRRLKAKREPVTHESSVTPDSVTPESSVTPDPVTQLSEIGDAPLDGSVTHLSESVTHLYAIGDAEAPSEPLRLPPYRPPEYNRPCTAINTNSPNPDGDGAGAENHSHVRIEGTPVSATHPRPHSEQVAPAVLDRDIFISELTEVLNGHGQTNAAHRNRALQMAQQYGKDVFLGALEHWLREEGEFHDIPAGRDPITDEVRTRPRTWMLQHFLENYAIRYIKIVQPHAHLARGPALSFIIELAEDEPEFTITREQAQKITEILRKWPESLVWEVVGFDSAKGLDDFLNRADGLLEEAAAKVRAKGGNKTATVQ
jgi:Helix-turn-helix domain